MSSFKNDDSNSPSSTSNQDSSSFHPIEQLYHSIDLTLDSIKLQQERIIKFQNESYRWHVQHHNNIKRLMRGLNDMLERINSSQDVSNLDPFQIEEDESLFYQSSHMETNLSSAPRPTPFQLHSLIMKHQHNTRLLDENLTEYIQSCFPDSFHLLGDTQLQHESFLIAFERVALWLQRKTDAHSLANAIFFLHGTIRHVPQFFTNLTIIESCMESMRSFDDNVLNIIGVSESILREVFYCLERMMHNESS